MMLALYGLFPKRGSTLLNIGMTGTFLQRRAVFWGCEAVFVRFGSFMAAVSISGVASDVCLAARRRI
jgi:hypothetical protein